MWRLGLMVTWAAIVAQLAGPAVAQTPTPPSWSWMGPASWHLPGTASPALGGQLEAVLPIPGVPGAAWVAGMGGVWKYSPGSGWSPTSLAAPATALASDSGNTVILAGTGNGLWLSADGGASWAPPPGSGLSGLAVNRLLRAGDGSFWAATSGGLFQSSDLGQTWVQKAAGAFWDVAESGTTVLGASASTLTAIPTQGWKRAALCPNPAGGFFVLTAEPTSLWALSAAAATALPLPTGFSDTAAALALADDGTNLWMGGVGLWKGQSQVTFAVGTPNVHAIGLDAAGGPGWVATDTGLASTTGQDLSPGLTNFAAADLVLSAGGVSAPMAPAGVAGAPSGDMDWTVSDATTSWTALSDCRAQGGAEWALDGAGTLWLWDGADAAWVKQTSPSGAPFTGLACSDQRVWLSSSPFGAVAAISDSLALRADGTQIQFTDDAGTTWATIATLGANVTALAEDPLHTNLLVAATAAGVEASLDGGGIWVALPTGLPPAPVTRLLFDSAENLWASTLGRGIWMIPLAGLSRSLTLQGLPTAAVVAGGAALPLTAAYTVMGAPAANVPVEFSYSRGTQSAGTASAVTNAQGLASVPFTPPQQAGQIAVLATVGTGAQALSAAGEITIAPAAPARIGVVGDGQSAINGTPLPQPIELSVADAFGNPVPNVVLALSASGGTFSAPTATTGADGQASVTFTLPVTVGSVTLTATAAGLTRSWPETALATPGYSLALTPPSTPPAPNSPVSMQVEVQTTTGWTAPVDLRCAAPLPCQINGQASAPVLPGVAASVTFATGSITPGDTSVTVSVQSVDGTHAVSATVPIQAITLGTATPGAAAIALQPGQSQQITLTVTPINGATGAVTLALQPGSNLPASISTAFVPQPSVMLPGGGADGAATARFAVTAAASTAGSVPPLLLLLLLPLLFRRRRRILGVVALGIALAGCGGGYVAPASPAPQAPAPPAPSVATYAVTVVATAGKLQATLPVTITVTQ